MTTVYRPLPGGLGIQVTGLDVGVLDRAGRERLRMALAEHLLLVLRQTQLTPGQQVELTDVFGAVEPVPCHWGAPPSESSAGVQLLSNRGSNGLGVGTASLVWHTDQSFMPSPTPVTVLYAVELPSQGGDTLFADMRTAYERLPAETKATVDRLRARHTFAAMFLGGHSASGAPSAVHPLAMVNPVTGRRALYLNRLCLEAIEGLSPDDGRRLLDELYRHALRPEFTYRHAWQAGDVLVWDNFSLMHRAADVPTAEPRVLRRSHTRGASGPVGSEMPGDLPRGPQT
jgi:taurine dioxygenase